MSVLVTKEAPDFVAPAVMPNGVIKEDFKLSELRGNYVDALQFTEQYGEVCPAGWNKGETGMKPTAEGVAAYLSKHADDL